MAETGRPPKKGETVTFKVSVPKPLYGYLTYLAENSHIGGSENEVAAHLLKLKVHELAETKFHELQLPQGGEKG